MVMIEPGNIGIFMQLLGSVDMPNWTCKTKQQDTGADPRINKTNVILVPKRD